MADPELCRTTLPARRSAEELRGLTDVPLRHEHVWVLSDDIYEHLVYDGFEFVTAVALEPRLKERTPTMNGVAKAYAMTGWRIGYGGLAELIRAMAKVHIAEHEQSLLDQPGGDGRGANGLSDLYMAERAWPFKERRDLVVEMLNAAPGIRCHWPEGAFYVYPTLGAGVIGWRTREGEEIADSEGFARYLLERDGVSRRCTVPPSASTPICGSPTPPRPRSRTHVPGSSACEARSADGPPF